MINKIKNIFKNEYIFTLINKILTILFGLFTSAFINRYAGPDLKGEYVVLLNYLNIFAVFANLGIYQAYPYYKRSNKDDNVLNKFVNIFYYQFIIYLFIFIILLLFSNKSKLIIVMFMLPFSVLTNQLNFILLVDNIKYRNKISIYIAIIKCVLSAITYYFLPQNIIFLILNLFLYDLLIIIFSIIKLKVKLEFKYFDIKFINQIMKFGSVTMITSLLITLNYKIDVLMLNGKVSDIYIGYYSVGVALAELGWLIPDTFKEVLFSKTAKSDSIKSIIYSLKISFYLIILIIVGIIIFGKSFITIIYGVEFKSSYGITIILFLGIPAMAFFKIISTLYLAKGKKYFYLISLLISVVCNIILNILLIPHYSIYGSAFASVVSYTVCGSIYLIHFCRDYKIKIKDIFAIKKSDINMSRDLLKKLKDKK